MYAHTLPFRSVRLLFAAVFLIAALLAVVLSHGSRARSGAPGAAVLAGDYWFCSALYQEGVCDTPIDAGGTVTWDFSPAVAAHTVVDCGASCDTPSASPAYDSGVIADGSTFQYTFSQPGVYLYYCDLHPTQMRGRIIVGGATPLPTATPTRSGPNHSIWSVRPDLRVARFAYGFDLPVNIAFAPETPEAPNDPYFYVTQLYKGVAVVKRDGTVSQYAGDILNYDPTGAFPGTGENGVDGIAIEPETGNVYITTTYADGDALKSEVLRLPRSADGLTATGQEVVLNNIPAIFSHQIQQLTFGPDEKLYVNTGDGGFSPSAQDVNDLRGKVLRIDPADGSRPDDNPIDGSLAYAIGLRNPFGATWGPDGKLYVTDNGPDRATDRIVRVEPGGNYGWCCDQVTSALYVFEQEPRVSSIMALAFDTNHILSPAGETHLFVGAAGATYARGPMPNNKTIFDLKLNDAGEVVEVSEVLHYIGDGYSSVAGMAFGPDGLYFSDLYGDGGLSVGPGGGNIYRIYAPSHATPTASPPATGTPTPTATPVLSGDVNCSGQRDSIDAALVLQLDAGLIDALPCAAGDLNHDGSTNSIDALVLLQFAAGLITL